MSASAPVAAPAAVRGILLKLTSVAVFAVMAACVKAARVEVPAGEAMFFRALLALPPVFAWAAWQGRLAEAVSTRAIGRHAVRGAVGASAMMLGFTALGLLPLPEVVAIGFAAPLIAVVLAVWLLKETVRVYRWTAVGVGLIGVMIMIWPRLTVLSAGGLSDGQAIGAAIALGSAALMALAQIQVRWLTRTEPVLAIVFWFHVSCCVAALFTLPFGWVWPGIETLALLVAAGITGGVAQIFLTESYRHADASTIAPFDYAMMIFGLGIGFFVFGEVAEWQVLGGGAVVTGAGLYILHRERQLGLLARRGAARRAMTPQG